ncbi:MAG TPA: hypothetical protein VGO14_03610 [Solirubrobacteraceae bacterium]|nr:hypothetical protein [Solirubrobacteraceae bacterium]
MDSVSGPTDMTVHAREDLRIAFYRAYRRQPGFCSVKLRRGDEGRWLVDVGASEDVEVPTSYCGLPVYVHASPGAINAVARI